MNKILSASVAAIIGCSATQAIADSERPEWLDRTDVSITEAEDDSINFAFETIQPLMETPETKRHTVFVQGRVASKKSDVTINLGIGYRNLTDDESMLYGINGFLDQTTEYGHSRASVGLEAMGKTFTFRGNYYSALSGEKKKTKGAITTYQEALDGYDVSVDTPVPYVPWMRARATGYNFSAKKGFKDVSGTRVTVFGNIRPDIGFELGVNDDNYNGSDAFLKVVWALHGTTNNGINASLLDGQLTSDAAYAERDLRQHTLDKVVRQNSVTVQTRGGVVIGRTD